MKKDRDRMMSRVTGKKPVKPTVGEIIGLLDELNELEEALYGLCRVCLNNGESTTDTESPCFEYGLQCLQNGYFPKCEHWEI